MSRLRPVHSCRSTWLNGSSRDPNLLLVRRTPLATARTLPCRRGRTLKIPAAPPPFLGRRGAPLAVPAGEHRDDPVGLAQLLGAQDDALVPVQRLRRSAHQ